VDGSGDGKTRTLVKIRKIGEYRIGKMDMEHGEEEKGRKWNV